MAKDSSLELLIEINQSEREAQLSHFESLDTKSGLVLGFAGVLIALGNGAGSVAGTGSTTFAAIAALAAVSSFWPRRSHPSTRHDLGTMRSANSHSLS